MGQYDGIKDINNWHFAVLLYCGNPRRDIHLITPVPFSETENQTNEDLGCVLSIGEKSFKNSVVFNENKFKQLDISIKRHEPWLKMVISRWLQYTYKSSKIILSASVTL